MFQPLAENRSEGGISYKRPFSKSEGRGFWGSFNSGEEFRQVPVKVQSWVIVSWNRDNIVSVAELIADVFSDFLSLCFESHMSHMDISSLHAKTVNAKLKSGIHIHDR